MVLLLFPLAIKKNPFNPSKPWAEKPEASEPEAQTDGWLFLNSEREEKKYHVPSRGLPLRISLTSD